MIFYACDKLSAADCLSELSNTAIKVWGDKLPTVCFSPQSYPPPFYLPLSGRQFKRCCFKQNHLLVCMREHLSFKCYIYLFQDKKKRTEMNKSRCNLFIEGVLIDAWWVCLWVPHVEREGFQNPRHAATLLSSRRVTQSLSGSSKPRQADFSVNRRGEREFRVTGGGGLRREWAEWKQMSGALDAKCACVRLCVCVCPTAALRSYLSYHSNFLLSR